MSRTRSIYIILFQPHFHYNESYNLIKTDAIVSCTFLGYLPFFWMITWMKAANNFQLAKVQLQSVA